MHILTIRTNQLSQLDGEILTYTLLGLSIIHIPSLAFVRHLLTDNFDGGSYHRHSSLLVVKTSSHFSNSRTRFFYKNGEFFHRGSTFLFFFKRWDSNILSIFLAHELADIALKKFTKKSTWARSDIVMQSWKALSKIVLM